MLRPPQGLRRPSPEAPSTGATGDVAGCLGHGCLAHLCCMRHVKKEGNMKGISVGTKRISQMLRYIAMYEEQTHIGTFLAGF